MRLQIISFVVSVLLSTGNAMASCQVDSPDPSSLPSVSGDFPTGVGWRYKQLIGNKITYEDGSWERYNEGNTYEYSRDGKIWTAPSFRFYKNGFSCVDFPIPRFRLYLINKTELFMIDGFGDRHKATIVK